MKNNVILAYLGEDRGFIEEERKAEIGLKKVPKFRDLRIVYPWHILNSKI